MATLRVEKLDDFVRFLEDYAQLPDEVITRALTEMETIAADGIKASGEAYRVRDPESDIHILDNIKMTKPKRTENGGFADVNFSGTIRRGNTTVRNAEIAFINEYGKRGQQARPFIGEAMNKNADRIIEAGEKIIGEWLDKN